MFRRSYTIIRERINALPDYGVYCTETCRSCFDVNFNVNFKIVLRQFTCAPIGE